MITTREMIIRWYFTHMISTCGQDGLLGITSSFSKDLGLTGLSLLVMQIQRVDLERGNPAEKETGIAGEVSTVFILGI